MKTLIKGMRTILCDKCGHKFKGHGTTRVMRKLVFNFCAECWADRRACEQHMDRVSTRGLK